MRLFSEYLESYCLEESMRGRVAKAGLALGALAAFSGVLGNNIINKD